MLSECEDLHTKWNDEDPTEAPSRGCWSRKFCKTKPSTFLRCNLLFCLRHFDFRVDTVTVSSQPDRPRCFLPLLSIRYSSCVFNFRSFFSNFSINAVIVFCITWTSSIKRERMEVGMKESFLIMFNPFSLFYLNGNINPEPFRTVTVFTLNEIDTSRNIFAMTRLVM